MANELRTQAVQKVPGIAIELPRLFEIESNHQTDAVGAKGDMGLGQLTPVAVADWNQMHPNEQYQHTPEHMFDPEINGKISDWLVNQRAPQLLNHYGIPDTIENRLATYKAGIGNVVAGKAFTPATMEYIEKYKKATGRQQ